MNWELFYLVCFVVGFTFSVLSFVVGLSRFHLHLPKHFHFGGHAGGHVGGHAGHVGHAGHGPASHSAKSGTHGGHFPIVNPMTTAAFLTWFGGTGDLLVHLRHIWGFAGLALSTLAGPMGWALVFWVAAKVLMARDFEMDPMHYQMVGVLGHVSRPVRENGPGGVSFIA